MKNTFSHQAICLLLMLLGWNALGQMPNFPCKDKMDQAKSYSDFRDFLQSQGNRPDPSHPPSESAMKKMCDSIDTFINKHKAEDSGGVAPPSTPPEPATQTRNTPINNGQRRGSLSSGLTNALKVRPSVAGQKDISYTDAQNYIKDFMVKFNQTQHQVELSGLIPNACKASLSVNGYKGQDTNSLKFEIVDRTGSGLACLKKNEGACTNDEKQCSQLTDLFSDPTFSRQYKTIVGLEELKAGTLKVGYTYFDGNKWQTTTNNSTNDDDLFAIDSCGCKRTDMPKVMNDGHAKNVQDILDVTTKAAAHPAQLGPDVAQSDEMKEHMKRVQERMLKKIKSSPCPKPGEDSDDGDMDPSSMMSEMGDMDGDDDMKGRFSKGGPPDGMKMDLSFQDDLQDAIDAKMEKCMKKQRSNMSIGGAGQMGGRMGGSQFIYAGNSNGFGAMSMGRGMPMGFGGQIGNGGMSGMSGMGMTGMNGLSMGGMGYSGYSPFMSSQFNSPFSSYGGYRGYGGYGGNYTSMVSPFAGQTGSPFGASGLGFGLQTYSAYGYPFYSGYQRSPFSSYGGGYYGGYYGNSGANWQEILGTALTGAGSIFGALGAYSSYSTVR